VMQPARLMMPRHPDLSSGGELCPRGASIAVKHASRILVVLALCAGSFATETRAASSGPSPGLSKNGQMLWQFEALLHDSFGDHAVCASGRWGQKFISGQCSPHAVYSLYSYVFAHARGSSFHTSAKKRVGGFGNHPSPITHPRSSDRVQRA